MRAFSGDVIPRYLVEQIKDREFAVDDFYSFQRLNCVIEDSDGHRLNPFNHLYALADEQNKVKGFLWGVIDPLGKDFVVNTFSVDPIYWQEGGAMKKATEYIKQLLKKLQLKKVFWITKYPRHSERHGFKKSRHVLMEYQEEESGKDTDGGNDKERKCRSADTPTKESVRTDVK